MQEVKVNLTTQLKVTKQMVEDASLVAQVTTRFLSYVLLSLDHSICHINAFFSSCSNFH
jgi:hypothetical protein